MNTRLENRKVVEKLLGPAVEGISLAPVVVTTIAEGPIDAAWIKALEELKERSKAVQSGSNGSSNIRAVSDVKPLLDDLIHKVFPHYTGFLHSRAEEGLGYRTNPRFLRFPNQGHTLP